MRIGFAVTDATRRPLMELANWLYVRGHDVTEDLDGVDAVICHEVYHSPGNPPIVHIISRLDHYLDNPDSLRIDIAVFTSYEMACARQPYPASTVVFLEPYAHEPVDDFRDRQLFQFHALERQLASLASDCRKRVHFFCEEIHYYKHVSTVVHALPNENRGLVICLPATRRQALLEGQLVYTPADAATAARVIRSWANPSTSLAYCVGQRDHQQAHKLRYPVIRAEHGSGQSYSGCDSESYAGSSQHSAARLCLYPGYHPYLRHLKRKCRSTARMVGAPILDRWVNPTPGNKAVGFAFHWDCAFMQETRSTFDWWLPALGVVTHQLRAAGYSTYLHAHPRWADRLKGMLLYQCTWVEDREEFLGKIDVLAADNTSLIFEAAALNRMIVLLNAPAYRNGKRHGLRFDEAADVGIPCNSHQDLFGAITRAQECWSDDVMYRESALDFVYRYRDQPTLRTVAYLLEELNAQPSATLLRPIEQKPVGLWRMLMSDQYQEYLKVTKPSEAGERKLSPGEIILKSDLSPQELKKLQRDNAVEYSKSAEVINHLPADMERK